MRESDRVEAFSDGVIAVAITLLVFDLKVPTGPGSLAHALGSQWTSYAAYVLSFATIGIIWVNHHTVFAHVARVDRPLMMLNLLLLFWVAVLPYPTTLVAHYIRSGNDARVAMALYSGVMLGCAIAFTALWAWITRDERLLHAHIHQPSARAALRRFGIGPFVYLATIVLSLISPLAALVVHFALAIYYVFDQLPVHTLTEER